MSSIVLNQSEYEKRFVQIHNLPVFDLVIYRLLTRKRANITNELSYKYDGEKYYRPATVQVIDYDEIIVTTDYGVDVGRITQYFVRLLD